jgi:hypothetical protein
VSEVSPTKRASVEELKKEERINDILVRAKNFKTFP